MTDKNFLKLNFPNLFEQFKLSEIGLNKQYNNYEKLLSKKSDREPYWMIIIPLVIKILMGIILSNLFNYLLFKKKNLSKYKIFYFANNSIIIKSKKFIEIVDSSILVYPPTVKFKNIVRHKNNIDSSKLLFTRFVFDLTLLKNVFLYVFDKGQIIHSILSKKFKVKQFHYTYIRDIIFYYWAEKFISDILVSHPQKLITFFEHDNGGKFLFLAELFNQKKIPTVHVQHGSFFEVNEHYKPISRYFLACSNREKNLLVNEGIIKEDQVFVYGAPLQVHYHKRKDFNRIKKRYKCLIISSFVDNNNYANVIKFYKVIDSYFGQGDYLVRFRPASYQNDKKYLIDKIKNAELSDSKSSLVDDILSSEIIISFSIDSLHHCLELNKRVVFILDKNIMDTSKVLPPNDLITVINSPDILIQELDNYRSDYEPNNSARKFIEENFGTTNERILLENINFAIKNIFEEYK